MASTSSFLAVALIAITMAAALLGGNECNAARILAAGGAVKDDLPVPLPELPVPMPPLPQVPIPPVPEVPGVPLPPVPQVPGVPLPPLPSAAP